MELIRRAGAEPAGVLIGLNRQERGKGERSAIQEVEDSYGIPVISIVDLDNVTAYLKTDPSRAGIVSEIEAYRAEYGV